MNAGRTTLSLAALALAACGQIVVPSDPISRDQLVPGRDGALEYRRPAWCAPCAPCDCLCADPIGTAPRTEHVVIGDEASAFRATITTPFWLGRHEMSVRCVELCRIAGACAPHTVRPEVASMVVLPARADAPAIELTLDGARAACRFFGGRLPTNAQWEFAARGTDGRRFPWGNEIDCSRGSFAGFNEGHDCRFNVDAWFPVGAFPSGAGPFGTMDLLGGVFEWVDDTAPQSWYEAQRRINEQGREPLPRVPGAVLDRPFTHGGMKSSGINAGSTWGRYGAYPEPPFNTVVGGEVGARCLWDRAPSQR